MIEKASGKPFRQLLAENILEKIGMTDSVPGQDALSQKALLTAVGPTVEKRYEATLARMWDSAEAMPSLPEIGEPRLWLARTV